MADAAHSHESVASSAANQETLPAESCSSNRSAHILEPDMPAHDATVTMAALDAAISDGCLDIVAEQLPKLCLAPVISTVIMPDWLVSAAAKGHAAVVACLLEDPRADASVVNAGPLDAAVKGGHLPVIELLLAYAQLDAAAAKKHARSALQLACAAEGGARIVALLLQRRLADPGANSQEAILVAARAGNADVVQLLLADPCVNPAVAVTPSQSPLIAAVRGNHLRVVDLLLRFERSERSRTHAFSRYAAVTTCKVDAAAFNEAAVRVAASHGFVDVVERLLQHADGPSMRTDGFLTRTHAAAEAAAAAGNVPMVARLLQRYAVAHAALCGAAQRGQLAVLDFVLAHPESSRCAASDFAAVLCAAVGSGSSEAWEGSPAAMHAVLERLLADPRVDPAASKGRALSAAVAAGNDAAALRLLADCRIDPSERGNEAISLAPASCGVAVIDALLADPRVDPSAHSSWGLLHAVAHGNVAVLERLLADPRVVPHGCAFPPLAAAAECGHVALLERLLQHPTFCLPDDSGYFFPLQFAASRGRLAAVERLLAEPAPCFHPAGMEYDAVSAAASRGHVAVVQRLLDDPRVGPEFDCTEALQRALRHGSRAAVHRLVCGLEGMRWAARRSESDSTLMQRLLQCLGGSQAELRAAAACRRVHERAASKHAGTYRCCSSFQLTTVTGEERLPVGAATAACRTPMCRFEGATLRIDEEAEADAAAIAEAGFSDADAAEREDAGAGGGVATSLGVPLPLPSSLLNAALRLWAELQARRGYYDDALKAHRQIRRLVCTSDIAVQAWLRRRAVVLARVGALAPDADV